MKSMRRWFLILMVLCIATGSLSRLYRVSIDHLRATHDICFETYNLATIKAIQAGHPIYDSSLYSELPFIISIYNPIYHWIVAAIPNDTDNPFLTGRLVSLAATLAVALLLVFPGNRNKEKWMILLVISWFFLIREPVRYAAYLKNDTLALFFSGCALVLMERSQNGKWRMALSALLCFLAFATKQTYLAASGACFCYLYFKDRKRFWVFAGVLIGFFSAGAVIIPACFGSGYWFSCYLSLSEHPIRMSYWLLRWKVMFLQPLFLGLMCCTFFTLVLAFLQRKRSLLWDSPYPLYVFLSLLMLSATLGKLGSNTEYFLEPILASLFWLLYYVRNHGWGLLDGWGRSALTLLFLCLAMGEVFLTQDTAVAFTNKHLTAKRQAIYDAAFREIQELDLKGRRFLLVDTKSPLYSITDKVYVNDVVNYWNMWSMGVLNIENLIRPIKEQHFDLILFMRRDPPYNIVPAIPIKGPIGRLLRETIEKHYRLIKRGVFHYYVRRNADS